MSEQDAIFRSNAAFAEIRERGAVASAVISGSNGRTWRTPHVTAAAARPRAEPAASGRRRSLLGYLVMPRPKDLFKALLMPLAFGLAVLSAGGASGGTVLRAAVVLVALELLVYPARYQWNDVRGFAADQRHPDEADRGRLPGPAERARQHVTASCAVAIGRVAVTLALPFLLPGLHLGGILLWVVLGVFGVAAAYEALRTLGTGRSGTVPPPVRPAIVLLWITVGAGYVVRGLTGLALVVDLPRDRGLAVAATVTLWAYGIAFVTSRWAIESTAFARLRSDRVEWTAEAAQAREHLLALVRWVPPRTDPGQTSADRWTALRGRTPVLAPWNVAMVIAGTAAAVTGRMLTGPTTTPETVVMAVAGALTGLGVVLASRGRVVAVAVGAVALAAVLALRDAPAPVVAVLPWAVVMTAYTRSSRQCLSTLGETGARIRDRLRAVLTPTVRVLVGRDTWNLLEDGPARG
jgi:hypothetical protein